jgi:thioredoxin-related protein
MVKVISIILLIILVGCSSVKNSSKNSYWQSWKQVVELNMNHEKPILIDIYTDWCVYCKVMDNTVYKNDSVIQYLKKHFYTYKLNAEKNDSVFWKNTFYQFNDRYRVHDFAVFLTKGNIAYPSTVVLNNDGTSFFEVGALKLKEMEFFLRYFVEAYPYNISKEDFTKKFKPRWKK